MTSTPDTTRSFLFGIGMIMVLVGVVMLLFLGVVTYMAVTVPEQVTIVQFIIDNVRAGDTAFHGHVTDTATGRRMEYQFEISESVRAISFLFMGIGIMGVLALILRVLIASGIQLVRLGMSERKT